MPAAILPLAVGRLTAAPLGVETAAPVGDLPVRMASLVQPLGDLGRVEPNQPAYLEVRHPPLGDETADIGGL